MRIRPAGAPAVGSEVTFASGQFAGRTFRAELYELQKADLGRKYARKDRRPLDPPPIVQLKLIEILAGHTQGDKKEKVMEHYDDYKSFGFICHVDLFPVPSEEAFSMQKDPPINAIATSVTATHWPISPTSAISQSTSNLYLSAGSSPASSFSVPPPHPPSSYAMHASGSSRILSSYISTSSAPPMFTVPAPAPPSLHTPDPEDPLASASASSHDAREPHQAQPRDIVAYADSYIIRESSKCTQALAGESFVQGCTPEYKGTKTLMFVFSDLAVREEGSFCLRYRVFNIFNEAIGPQDLPILAECFGGPFRVYSTKDFPGLRASTDLTKHISFFGVRLNLRETERKRRKKSETDAEPTSSTPASKNGISTSAALHSPAMSNSSASSAGSRKWHGKGKSPAWSRRRESGSDSGSNASENSSTQ